MKDVLTEIPRVPKLDYPQLMKFIKASVPVVSTGEINHWPALRKWDFQFFRERYGDTPVTVSDGTSRRLMDMPMAHYLGFVESADLSETSRYNGATPYLQDWTGFATHPELSEHTPEHHWIRNWEKYYARLFRFFYQPASIFIGPKGACTYLHQDRDYTHAWLSQIKGRKRWILYPPSQGGLLTYRKPGSSQLFAVNALNPDLQQFPDYPLATPLEVILEPGETIFLPGGWWHQVTSLDATISVTGSYWNGSNAWPFLKSRVKDRTRTFLARLRKGPKEQLKEAYAALSGKLPDATFGDGGNAALVQWKHQGRDMTLAGAPNLLELTAANWDHGRSYTSFTADRHTSPEGYFQNMDWDALQDLIACSPLGQVKVLAGFSAARVILYGLIIQDLNNIRSEVLHSLERLVVSLPQQEEHQPEPT